MKLVAFGEIMLRLTPPGHCRIMQEPSFGAVFGGSEANVALSLAAFGAETSFVTKLPRNDLADACVRELRGFGVDVSGIARGGDRMGLYFLEKGAGLRAGKVIYDRAHSAISEAVPEDFDWDTLLDGATNFHFTGITPALSDSLAAITSEAVKKAKEKGLTVSCDLNYRAKLWSKEKARSVMTGFMPYVDILIANDGSSLDVFGIGSDSETILNGEVNRNAYVSLAKRLTDAFGFSGVALTFRESLGADRNNFGGMYFDESGAYFSNVYPLSVVDRVGGGDGFAAGLLYGLMTGAAKERTVELAAAAGALKHTVEGDFNRVSVEEVEAICGGDLRALVQR